MFDWAGLAELVYQRARSHSQGATLRAALADGANSVILAQDIRRYEGETEVIPPPTPFLALRYGAAPSADQVVWQGAFTWLCYDDRQTGYSRLLALPPLIQAAYRTDLSLLVGEDTIEISPAAPSPDMVLKLLVLPVTLVIHAI